MLPGVSDAAAGENWIVPAYGNELPSTILLAGHHGSDSFFLKGDGTRYTKHIAAIRPRMTTISVGGQHVRPSRREGSPRLRGVERRLR
jgi:beta-lactamase superfamily II metal-dependent hydrolase